ncbi:unnamed protein product [Amoebophrya sp. A120]|nr:unnamed protein product [Amoebophrya sp. A120]|eukprot:GSA120T00013332001.1
MTWACDACTFLNEESAHSCEMCGTVRVKKPVLRLSANRAGVESVSPAGGVSSAGGGAAVVPQEHQNGPASHQQAISHDQPVLNLASGAGVSSSTNGQKNAAPGACTVSEKAAPSGNKAKAKPPSAAASSQPPSGPVGISQEERRRREQAIAAKKLEKEEKLRLERLRFEQDRALYNELHNPTAKNTATTTSGAGTGTAVTGANSNTGALQHPQAGGAASSSGLKSGINTCASPSLPPANASCRLQIKSEKHTQFAINTTAFNGSASLADVYEFAKEELLKLRNASLPFHENANPQFREQTMRMIEEARELQNRELAKANSAASSTAGNGATTSADEKSRPALRQGFPPFKKWSVGELETATLREAGVVPSGCLILCDREVVVPSNTAGTSGAARASANNSSRSVVASTRAGANADADAGTADEGIIYFGGGRAVSAHRDDEEEDEQMPDVVEDRDDDPNENSPAGGGTHDEDDHDESVDDDSVFQRQFGEIFGGTSMFRPSNANAGGFVGNTLGGRGGARAAGGAMFGGLMDTSRIRGIGAGASQTSGSAGYFQPPGRSAAAKAKAASQPTVTRTAEEQEAARQRQREAALKRMGGGGGAATGTTSAGDGAGRNISASSNTPAASSTAGVVVVAAPPGTAVVTTSNPGAQGPQHQATRADSAGAATALQETPSTAGGAVTGNAAAKAAPAHAAPTPGLTIHSATRKRREEERREILKRVEEERRSYVDRLQQQQTQNAAAASASSPSGDQPTHHLSEQERQARLDAILARQLAMQEAEEQDDEMSGALNEEGIESRPLAGDANSDQSNERRLSQTVLDLIAEDELNQPKVRITLQCQRWRETKTFDPKKTTLQQMLEAFVGTDTEDHVVTGGDGGGATSNGNVGTSAPAWAPPSTPTPAPAAAGGASTSTARTTAIRCPVTRQQLQNYKLSLAFPPRTVFLDWSLLLQDDSELCRSSGCSLVLRESDVPESQAVAPINIPMEIVDLTGESESNPSHLQEQNAASPNSKETDSLPKRVKKNTNAVIAQNSRSVFPPGAGSSSGCTTASGGLSQQERQQRQEEMQRKRQEKILEQQRILDEAKRDREFREARRQVGFKNDILKQGPAFVVNPNSTSGGGNMGAASSSSSAAFIPGTLVQPPGPGGNNNKGTTKGKGKQGDGQGVPLPARGGKNATGAAAAAGAADQLPGVAAAAAVLQPGEGPLHQQPPGAATSTNEVVELISDSEDAPAPHVAVVPGVNKNNNSSSTAARVAAVPPPTCQQHNDNQQRPPGASSSSSSAVRGAGGPVAAVTGGGAASSSSSSAARASAPNRYPHTMRKIRIRLPDGRMENSHEFDPNHAGSVPLLTFIETAFPPIASEEGQNAWAVVITSGALARREIVPKADLYKELEKFPGLFPLGGTILIVNSDTAHADNMTQGYGALPGISRSPVASSPSNNRSRNNYRRRSSEDRQQRLRRHQEAEDRRYAQQLARRRERREGTSMSDGDWSDDDDDLDSDGDFDMDGEDHHGNNEDSYGDYGYGSSFRSGSNSNLIDPFSPEEMAAAHGAADDPYEIDDPSYQRLVRQIGAETFKSKNSGSSSSAAASSMSAAPALVGPASSSGSALSAPPAGKESVGSAPAAAAGSSSRTTGNEEEVCAICQCPFQEGDDLGRLECFHRFHKNCIETGLRYSSQCPVCKYRLRE